jgi:hypothetical protein
MFENPVVHIGENSCEQIAYKLLITIASNEGKTLHSGNGGPATADRKWLLSTYAECLATVRAPHDFAKSVTRSLPSSLAR